VIRRAVDRPQQVQHHRPADARAAADRSRATLLQEVWGTDWTGGSNVVDVVVSALRRKLGDRAGALETVRGVGYRLRPLA
jgi:DNA-binding response OmpR family regulator